jgi:putative peptide zinc metalloprotease protein
VSSPQLRYRRRRAVAVSAMVAALVVAALFVVPVPYATVGEGVVWVPDSDILRAGGEGFAQALLAEPDSEVVAGQPVIQLEDPVAAAQLAVKRAELAVLEHRFIAVNLIDLVQARLVREQRERAAAQLARAEQRIAALVIRAPRSGRFVVPDARKLIGRFVREGDLVGYVISPGDISIRVVIPQAEIDPVRARVGGVSVRLTDDIDTSFPATIVRQTPAALERPPAPALAPEGGGPMLLDPTNPKQQRPLDQFFEIELTLASKLVDRIGGRVFARFDHGAEPLAWRGLRAARQLFLRAIHV